MSDMQRGQHEGMYPAGEQRQQLPQETELWQAGFAVGFRAGIEAATKAECSYCRTSQPEFQADPYPWFWHGNENCEAALIWLACAEAEKRT